VCVHESRHDDGLAGVDPSDASGRPMEVVDGRNAAVADEYRRGPHAVRQHDTFASDDEIGHRGSVDQLRRIVASIRPNGSVVATKISLRFSRPNGRRSIGMWWRLGMTMWMSLTSATASSTALPIA